MADMPLPEPARVAPVLGVIQNVYTAEQMRIYAAADNAALRAELARHQESEFHPDWSMLAATREGLAEHQQMIRDFRDRVKVLEDALRRVHYDKSFNCLKVEKTQQYVIAALGDKP